MMNYLRTAILPAFMLGLLLSIICSACGYKFGPRLSIPGNPESIAVLPFKNIAREPGLDTLITNSLITEFSRSGIRITADPSVADEIITGVIRRVTSRPVARTDIITTRLKRITVTIDVSIRDRDGNVIWARTGITDTQDYVSDPDRVICDEMRKNALKRIARRTAQKLFQLMARRF